MEKSLEAVLQETVEKLQAENADLKLANASIKSENEALEQENEALTAVNEELTAKVEELSKEPATSETAEEKKPEIPEETFAIGKKKYRFVTPVFVYNQQRIIAAAALKDSTLLAELVKIRSGFIQEV
jgi:hypothetical protein